ncbi:hypothetical protein IQ241_05985 [Romeria aff. gracilis LEGE 07310]|uniref:Uncharacterized protein n=1 Tax=Vasconcelosia minhoensis LEGE 07310 TaxID=915328 RepID=A0A8J7AUC8_9CYAN|nr:hypothetical protein [Romeria gracilis]MBE9076848.1 hypothetical protein [Romeria aff. gracilis LEGE 07310]
MSNAIWTAYRLFSPAHLPIGIYLLSALTGGVLTAAPATAAEDDFFECTSALLEADIETELAAAACASARYPEALSSCTIDVSEFTGLAATEALAVCERSRRPEAVADCTVSIYDGFLLEDATPALERCGVSLLPERYATCVVDLGDAAELSADDALTQCLRAGYRPWRMAPRL